MSKRRERSSATEAGATARRDAKPRIVSAILAYRWYDEIAARRKRIEYREICDYWTSRLWADGANRRVAAIKFNRGYTPVSMTWQIIKIMRNDKDGVYEIHLGERID